MWYEPTFAELSIAEQIETAVADRTLNPDERQRLIEALWTCLDKAHGSRVLRIETPEGRRIARSVFADME